MRILRSFWCKLAVLLCQDAWTPRAAEGARVSSKASLP
jgi:hypothetical protein